MKILYTAETHVDGGRNGHARSSDGKLDVDLSVPESLGGQGGDGTVFEVAAGSGIVTTLASFDGSNGAAPEASLVEDGNGNLFGTTFEGGAHGDGTVFEVKAGSDSITTLASFDGTNGAGSNAGLIEDGSGNLFGTTTSGGAHGDGELAKQAADDPAHH